MKKTIYSTLTFLFVSLFFSEVKAEEFSGSKVFTVPVAKRLIAKAIVQMPEVQKALKSGMVIVNTGTTNTYVAEELTGEKILHGSFVTGHVKSDNTKLQNKRSIEVIVLINGQKVDLTLDEGLNKLKKDDVVIKGGNALDYNNKVVGVLTGAPNGGTWAKVYPHVVARNAKLIIPIGLEKLVAGNLIENANRSIADESLNGRIIRPGIISGIIVTELEALNILTGVDAYQIGAGGVLGAEGSIRLVFSGSKEQVQKALELFNSIKDEPPFSETD